MPLWGAHPDTSEGIADPEAKPKFLTTEAKRDVYATDRGWTAPAGGNGSADAEREVLVAIGSLAGATKLADATISSVSWTSTTHLHSGTEEQRKIKISVNWNEVITVQAGANIAVTITGALGPSTVDAYCYDGSVANRALFQYDFQMLDEAWAPDDELSIEAQSIVGTITPAGTGVAISEDIATAAGTKTVGP